MIIKLPLEIDHNEPPEDAPPSYEEVQVGNEGPSGSVSFRDEKNGRSAPFPRSAADLPLPPLPPPVPPKSPPSVISPSSPSGSGSSFSNAYQTHSQQKGWFASLATSSRTAEVKSTTIRLVRQLIQDEADSVTPFGVPTGAGMSSTMVGMDFGAGVDGIAGGPGTASGSAATPASVMLLHSCADACAKNSVSFGDLIQEKCVEGHTLIYWAVVKRPKTAMPSSASTSPLSSTSHSSPSAGRMTTWKQVKDGESKALTDFLSTLLSFASPLKPGTVADIRQACLVGSDQNLFRRLKLLPGFSQLSGLDEMLLGERVIPDEVEVETLGVPTGTTDSSSSAGTPGIGDDTSFAALIELKDFHRRMVVSKQVVVEFVARGRMWRLGFYVVPPRLPHGTSSSLWGLKAGSWYVSLGLAEGSPPTYIDSRLLIDEPELPPPPPKSPSTPTPETMLGGFLPIRMPTPMSSPSKPKPKPTITLRLKSNDLLEAPSTHSRSGKFAFVSLDESLMAAGLQYRFVSFAL